MFKFLNRNQKKVTETLYEQNLELAVKNKTLSLLEELYQTSVLNLTPQEAGHEITNTIRQDLNLEFAGILIFDKTADKLTPLAFARSERLTRALHSLGFLFADITVSNVSGREFFKKAIYGKEENITNDFTQVWQELISSEHVEEIKRQSHIKTILVYPLIKGNGVLGVLMLGSNRDYNTLNTFEKASIKSFINVIGLLLDKAYLYKDLQDSLEVTKRAYAIEKLAKDELEKLGKIKNQFVQQTQHDLRTPLTSIMGYSDLLLNGSFGKIGPKPKEAILKLQKVAQNMIRKVNNFLDMTQFQLGKNPVHLAPGVELNGVLEEIMGELAFMAEQRKVYLKLQKLKKIITISADKEKLKTALLNVIDNCIKYTPEGGVTITVNPKSHPPAGGPNPNNTLLIEIKDTGIGISAENLKTLFNRMFERDEKAKQTAGGKGIGLYLATQIIKYHNGKIWAESPGEGKGTTFYVELPLS